MTLTIALVIVCFFARYLAGPVAYSMVDVSSGLVVRYHPEYDMLYVYKDALQIVTTVEKDQYTLRYSIDTGRMTGFSVTSYMRRVSNGLLHSIPEFPDFQLPLY